MKMFFLVDNWDDVCDEICRSNIIQRDNQKFARKLNKDLVKLAKERAVLVSIIFDFDNIQKNVLLQAKNDDNLWSERARRKVISAIISEWLKGNSKKTTVKKLMSALNGPGWFDVKLRVEKLLLVNVSTIS